MDAPTATSLPERIDVGAGTAFPLVGIDRGATGRPPVVHLDGSPQPTGSRPRGEDWEWWSVVELEPGVSGSLELELGVGVGGERRAIGEVPLGSGDAWSGATAGDARIAICMATHEPDPALFATQVDSIADQDRGDWICLISDDGSSEATRAGIAAAIEDDPRFQLLPPGPRLGFYRNFERALAAVPEGVEFVALADQDDRWYPDKLSELARLLESDEQALLVHSNYDVVDDGGRSLGDVGWMRRSGTEEDLLALLLCNTVTGAATMLRRELLDLALPFPPAGRLGYHDHWLALCARALGGLRYLDRRLYERTAHEQTVTAQVSGPLVPKAPIPAGVRPKVRGAVRRLQAGRGRSGWRIYHHDLVLPAAALGATLALRFSDRMTEPDLCDARSLGVTASDRALIVRLLGRDRALRDLGAEKWGREGLAARALIWRAAARPLAGLAALRTTISRG